MIDAGESTLTLPSDREIVMQRLFKTSAQTLFDVWTNPQHVRQWYAVRGTTMTVCDIDLCVGGKWRWVITRPPSLEVAFSGVFREIESPHRLQRTEVFEMMPGSESIVTFTFDETGDQTTFTMHMLFDNKQSRDICLKSGMEFGVKECFEKIDALVATL